MSYDRHHRRTSSTGYRFAKRSLTVAEAEARVASGRMVNVIGKDRWGLSKTVYVASPNALTEARLRYTRCRFYAVNN